MASAGANFLESPLVIWVKDFLSFYIFIVVFPHPVSVLYEVYVPLSLFPQSDFPAFF